MSSPKLPPHPSTICTALRTALPLALCAAGAAAAAVPSYDEVRQSYRSSDTLILDRSGEIIHRLRTDATVRRGEWVTLADMSPALRQAMLLSEDKRFYAHSGVDWQAVSAAAWGNLWNQRTRGASTITMQLAGLLDGDWKAGTAGRSVAQKLGQTVAAQVLERRWRKDQILESYLNLVPFRGEVVGIDALSRTLFGKAAHGLDEREAAVAAALVRAPNAKIAALVNRACGVQQQLARGPQLEQQRPLSAPRRAADCAGLDLFVTAVIQRKAFDSSAGVAPHAARRMVALAAATATTPNTLPDPAVGAATGWSVPQRLRSTLSAPLQRFAVQTLGRQLRELKGRQVEDGAIVVLDNASGEVLAWVGSSGDLSQASEVDAVLAPRQAGSTLKPFLYAQAIAEKRLTAASLLNDAPAHIPTASGLYIPQNYDRQFKGWVSVRTALAASLNVPAVRTLVMVSPDALQRQLRAAGLPLKESGEYYGYSLALGSAEVTLLSLTNAYRTLANGGRYSPTLLQDLQQRPPEKPKHQPSSTPEFTPALDPRAAFIVSDILSDSNARARTFGTDSVLATRFWTAVKTGTSKDMRDNWAVGYSQHYTVGVWVGNASGAAMHEVSGTTGAAPIWATLMQHLHAHRASLAPATPAGLTQWPVQFGGNLEAGRQEWFLTGTEQSLFAIDSEAIPPNKKPAVARNDSITQAQTPATATATATGRIVSPVSGTIVALDPDIPPQRQRLQLSAEGTAGTGMQWRLDGKKLANGPHAQWLPWPGRHVIQLTNARGELQDEVRVEVRGAGVR